MWVTMKNNYVVEELKIKLKLFYDRIPNSFHNLINKACSVTAVPKIVRYIITNPFLNKER